MSGNAIIKSLADKVELLMKESGRLRRERDETALRGEKLGAENRKLKQTVAALEKRIKVLELGGSFAGGDGDKKQAKARINRLVREIDRCIAMMNG
jgi:FtsZ-binding cell division protein ZapB